MKTIKLTSKEVEAIQELIFCSNEACRNGCVYPSMQKSNIDCSECDFTKIIHSISNKLS